MDFCEQILEKNDYNTIITDLKFNQLLQEFLKNSKNEFLFNDSIISSTEKVLMLKDYLYSSKEINLLFALLLKHHYNMREEIKDAIHELGKLRNPIINKAVIKKFLHSPVIQDITLNQKTYTITSLYGTFNFTYATNYLKKQKEIIHYIKTERLSQRCHEHTYFISKKFPEFYSITAHCLDYFCNNYYHSYTYNQSDDSIIDLCGNFVMEKQQYDRLYKPKEISIILNREVEKELAITLEKTDLPEHLCKLLKISLYKEYLQSISYYGPLKQAPPSKLLQK